MSADRCHVLYLAYFFPPLESAGYSIRAVKFLKYLSPKGWAFTVIAGDPQYPIVVPVTDSSRFLLEEVPADVNVIRVPAPFHIGSVSAYARGFLKTPLIVPIADRLWMHKAYRIASRLARQRPVDVILATAPPFTIPVISVKLKKRLGLPLILDFRDDWVDTPIFNAKPAWQKIAHRRLERTAISAADQIVTASKASLTHFQSRYPLHSKKFQYLPNGWDPDDMPASGNANSENEHFVITTAGGYQRADRSPEGLFRAIGRLIARRQDIGRRLRLQFIGAWLYQDFSTDELDRLGVKGVVEEIRPMAKRALMDRLRRAGLLLVIPTAYWTRSIPGKLYEYWAIGQAPILMLDNPDSAASTFVREHNLGCVVAQQDIAGIETAIERYYDGWVAGAPGRISSDGFQLFNRRKLASQLESVLLTTMSTTAANPISMKTGWF